VCAQLLDVDFGPPLHSFVIPGEMHHIEEEVVQTFRLDNQPASSSPVVEHKYVPTPPPTIPGAAVPNLDPAAISAAVSSWGVSFAGFCSSASHQACSAYVFGVLQPFWSILCFFASLLCALQILPRIVVAVPVAYRKHHRRPLT